MKKIASLLLVAALVLSLCACGCSMNDQTMPTTAPATATTAPTASTTAPSTAPTEDTILPDLPNPTMDSTLLPDSGLLDTSESTEPSMGRSGKGMK